MSPPDAERLNEQAGAFAELLIARRPNDPTEGLLALAWLEGWRKACEALAVKPQFVPSSAPL